MTMDTKIDQPSVVAAGAQVLAVLAERDVNLRTEIGAGDGMGLLVEALEEHKDNPLSSVALMAALTNMMYNHFENKCTFLQQNGLHILMEVLTRNSAADRSAVCTAALCLLRNLTNLDQVRSMEATKAVQLTRDLLPILTKFIENEKLVQHGAWSLLNLLHGSQQNKVILTERGGLEFVTKSLGLWKHTSTRVVEPVCLVVQQLAKLAVNRTALVEKGVVPLLVSVMENNHSTDGVVVLLPAAKSLYRLSFNAKNRRVIGASGAITHLLWPLNNALASPKLHRVIARALLKLCREDENKDAIRNEGGVGAIVTSMNFFRDNPTVTALMVRAMNCLFVKDGGSSSPSNAVKPASTVAPKRVESSSDSDSDGESPENSGSDSDSDTASPRTPDAAGIDDIDKIAAGIMASPRSPDDSADTVDVNTLVESLVATAAPAVVVTETADAEAAAALKAHEEELAAQLAAEAKKERDRLEAAEAEAAARAEAEADFKAEQERLKAEAATEAAAVAAAAKKREDEEAAAAAAARAKEIELLARKEAEEKAEQERMRKEAEEVAAAQKQELAAQKKREEEEAKKVEDARKAQEAAAAAAAAKLKEEQEAAAAAAAAAADRKRQEEAAAAAKKAAADKKAAEKAAEAEARRKEAEAAEAKEKAEREAADRKAAQEAADRKAAQEAADRKAAQEAADRMAAQEAADRKAAQEAADRKATAEAAERKAAQEAADREAAEKKEEARKAAEKRKIDEEKAATERARQKAERVAAEKARQAEAAERRKAANTPKPAAPSSIFNTKTVVVVAVAVAVAIGSFFMTSTK